MIVELLPEQVAEYWEEISDAIEKSLPPIADGEKEGVMEDVLESLIGGKLQCWTSYQMDGEVQVVNGIGTTAVIEDTVSKTRVLLIYSTYAVGPTTGKDWQEAFEGMVRYAQNRRCTRISAYTTNEKIVENARQFDAAEETYLSFDVGRFVELINKGEAS